MRQDERRDSKTIVVVDEDCGVPTSVVESYRSCNDSGPLAQTDPRSYLLSMSEYDKSHSYNVYDYNPTTRPEHGQNYPTFGAHQSYPPQYVNTQAQVPSGLPQSTALSMVPSNQLYSGTHDPTYYGQQYAQSSPYLASAPRQLPEIIRCSPEQGQSGTKVTVYFKSIYDFNSPPIRACLMFGSYKCESILHRTQQTDHMYHYALSADAPSLALTHTPDPVPLHLIFDDSPVPWESASLELGTFHYLDTPVYYPSDSPQEASKKRKLSPQASPRRSPPKKASAHNLDAAPGAPVPSYSTSITPSSPLRRPSLPEAHSRPRRLSTQDYTPTYTVPLSATPTYFPAPAGQGTPSLARSQSPSWSYLHGVQATRSPSTAAISATSRTSALLPSPAAGHNPPLIRTSTLQQPSPPPGTVSSVQGFNPYTIYPANTKAQLVLEGELNSMVNNWTTAEWDAKRRLVQFKRSQSGNLIRATFEAVTLEDRTSGLPCVSCIWWEEKRECYVTSVDTISLLEALVAVRFTVEEKNRIRRNLEGFRPATVSKAKVESEEFFKLIMGFPNPKPRNIEKDVKVFPWRILATALKKIIGKYSASYSSTAGPMQAPIAGPSYTTPRLSDAQHHSRPVASPRSASSSAPSHGQTAHAYAPIITTSAYSPAHVGPSGVAGFGLGPSAGPTELRVAVPVSTASQTTAWHPSPATFPSDVASHNRVSFDWNYSLSSSPATGLPGVAQAYQFQPQPQPQQRFPSLTSQAGTLPTIEAHRFVPLHEYEEQSQPTSTV